MEKLLNKLKFTKRGKIVFYRWLVLLFGVGFWVLIILRFCTSFNPSI